MDPATLESLAREAAAAVDADALIGLTRELIRMPSVFRPDDPEGNEAQVAGFLVNYLHDLGLDVRAYEVAQWRPNVVADWTFERTGRSLILEGHTDVVTEGDPRAWTHPPFEAVTADGRIYGRGAADMKGGLAAAIIALEAVRRAAPHLPGRVRLAAVVDEEAMMIGVKSLIREGHAQGFHGAIVCEPEENEICLHQKGALRVLATCTGKMAHGAMPYAGINPIPWAGQLVLALVEENARQQRRHGGHEYLGVPHITPTTIRAPAHGEPQFNVMAGEAQVTIDVRTIPGQDHAAVLQDLEGVAARVRAADARARISLEVIEDRPWTETRRAEPIVRAVERACETVQGRPPRYGGVPGSTDGTFLHAWAGIPIVTIGPGRREIPHQVDEYVEVTGLVEAARIYAAAIVYFLGEQAGDST